MFLLLHDKVWGRVDNKAFVLNDVAAFMWRCMAMGNAKEDIVITAYIPEVREWSDDYTKRMKP